MWPSARDQLHGPDTADDSNIADASQSAELTQPRAELLLDTTDVGENVSLVEEVEAGVRGAEQDVPSNAGGALDADVGARQKRVALNLTGYGDGLAGRVAQAGPDRRPPQ